MNGKNKNIETLLERFFEGQTSNEEERQLYLFFRQDEIPEELIRYKPVVTYFASGLFDELEGSMQKPLHVSNRKKQWIFWSSIAASFLIILCSTLFFFNNTKSFDPYEGSYIIRNGVRITDLDIIRPELEATVQKAMQQEAEIEQMIARLTEMATIENLILQQIEEQHRQLLDNFTDENIRKEVQQILNTNL